MKLKELKGWKYLSKQMVDNIQKCCKNIVFLVNSQILLDDYETRKLFVMGKFNSTQKKTFQSIISASFQTVGLRLTLQRNTFFLEHIEQFFYVFSKTSIIRDIGKKDYLLLLYQHIYSYFIAELEDTDNQLKKVIN